MLATDNSINEVIENASPPVFLTTKIFTMIELLLGAIKGTDLSGFEEKIKIALPLIAQFKKTIPLQEGEIEVAINLRFNDNDIIIYVMVLGVKEIEGVKTVVITRTIGTYKVSEYITLS